MSTAGPEGPPLVAPLARRLGAQPTAAQVAAAVSMVWDDVEGVLTPIIGRQGVVALYRRSLHLTLVAHPWMAAAPNSAQPALPPAALRSLLAAKDSAAAAKAGSTFLHSSHVALASVVGASLTERLLRSVWADPSSGTPAAVVKERASAHSNQWCEFSIGEDGMRIGARLPGQEGLLAGRPTQEPDASLTSKDAARP